MYNGVIQAYMFLYDIDQCPQIISDTTVKNEVSTPPTADHMNITKLNSTFDFSERDNGWVFNQNFTKSSSYFENMFLYIQKVMIHAIADVESDHNTQPNMDVHVNSYETTMMKFEEMKRRMVKEMLCLIFSEKGYPKPSGCNVQIKLLTSLTADTFTKLTNNLRNIPYLKLLEKPQFPLLNVSDKQVLSYTHSNTRYVMFK